jgi:hypothetical protein
MITWDETTEPPSVISKSGVACDESLFLHICVGVRREYIPIREKGVTGFATIAMTAKSNVRRLNQIMNILLKLLQPLYLMRRRDDDAPHEVRIPDEYTNQQPNSIVGVRMCRTYQ